MTDVTSCENAQNSPWVPFFARPVGNVLARESAFLLAPSVHTSYQFFFNNNNNNNNNLFIYSALF